MDQYYNLENLTSSVQKPLELEQIRAIKNEKITPHMIEEGADLRYDEVFFYLVNWDQYSTDKIHLSEEETDYANKILIQKKRNQFIKCRKILRYLLSRHLECFPDGVEIKKDIFGKPHVLGKSKSIKFNVSHSNYFLAVIVLTPNQKQNRVLDEGVIMNVGVDLESLRRYELKQFEKENQFDFGKFIVDRRFAIARRFFTEEEQEWLKEYTNENPLLRYYKIWTLKEALLKAIGTGIACSLNSFSVLPLMQYSAEQSTEHWVHFPWNGNDCMNMGVQNKIVIRAWSNIYRIEGDGFLGDPSIMSQIITIIPRSSQ